MKKYCDFCWAKLHGGGCHVDDLTTRKLHCQKAMERAQETTFKNETQKVREYISYLSKRIRYLKLFQGDVLLSEYKYYCELRNQIKEWGKSHVIPYAYLSGKFSLEKSIEFYGVSKREFFRLIKAQRMRLVKFIEEQEEALAQKYPFIPMSDIFCEE